MSLTWYTAVLRVRLLMGRMIVSRLKMFEGTESSHSRW